MSTSTIAFPSHSNSVAAYARNVGMAARGLIAALLAVRPVKADAQIAGVERAVAAHGKPAKSDFSLFRLYCLASHASSYDAVSPKLARELQSIAARG